MRPPAVHQSLLFSTLAFTAMLSPSSARAQRTAGPSFIYYNGGNVGIGTNNPQANLDVRGATRVFQLGFGDPTGAVYPDNWLGMVDWIDGSTKWFHIGGITDGGLRRIALFADRTFISGRVGVGTLAPFNLFTIAGGSRPSTDALSGTAAFSLSAQGGGQTDDNLLMGVHTGDYSWIQAAKAGCCNRNLALNPNGGNVGIGTNAPQHLLSVDGAIGAKDVIVTNTGWSDYVFAPGYRLLPLLEVERHIQDNGHLPGIPSESEVKEKGVSVGEMQSKLLAKIEELTLHAIRQEKQMAELRRRAEQLEARLAALQRTTP